MRWVFWRKRPVRCLEPNIREIVALVLRNRGAGLHNTEYLSCHIARQWEALEPKPRDGAAVDWLTAQIEAFEPVKALAVFRG